jgi:hypothetical protein
VPLWHYKVDGGSLDARHHGFLRFPGTARDSKGVVDALLARFWAAGFAHVEYFPVGASKFDGRPVLALELTAQAFPTEMDSARLELEANCVNQVIGKHRDEQMPTHPVGFLMINGA